MWKKNAKIYSIVDLEIDVKLRVAFLFAFLFAFGIHVHGFLPVKTWLLIACDTAFYAIISVKNSIDGVLKLK